MINRGQAERLHTQVVDGLSGQPLQEWRQRAGVIHLQATVQDTMTVSLEPFGQRRGSAVEAHLDAAALAQLWHVLNPDELAFMQDADAVADSFHFAEHVGRKEDGLTLRAGLT